MESDLALNFLAQVAQMAWTEVGQADVLEAGPQALSGIKFRRAGAGETRRSADDDVC